MRSNCQIWLTYDNEKEKVQLPVLPERLDVSVGGKNISVFLSNGGEVTILQRSPAMQVKFSSRFPAKKAPDVQVRTLIPPEKLVETILRWKNGQKASHLIVTGRNINLFCSIEDFSYYEEGEEPGCYFYSLSLKSYRDVSPRQIQVSNGSGSVTDQPSRPDNRVPAKTYVVRDGDCLWDIAQRELGDPYRYEEIYELNKDKVKSDYIIYTGQVLILPS